MLPPRTGRYPLCTQTMGATSSLPHFIFINIRKLFRHFPLMASQWEFTITDIECICLCSVLSVLCTRRIGLFCPPTLLGALLPCWEWVDYKCTDIFRDHLWKDLYESDNGSFWEYNPGGSEVGDFWLYYFQQRKEGKIKKGRPLSC